MRDVRDTNLCRIHVTIEPRTGRALVFAAIDNLWKGAAGQAVQNLNLMLGLDELEGADLREQPPAPSAFFRSRWVESPGRDRRARPRRAAGRLSRRRGRVRDQALRRAGTSGCCCATDDEATSAARFTRNAVVARP